MRVTFSHAPALLPLVALAVLLGVALLLVRAAESDGAARLHERVRAYCTALAEGEVDRCVGLLPPSERSSVAAKSQRSRSEACRGARFVLLSVTTRPLGRGAGDEGVSEIQWIDRPAEPERLRETLRWQTDADGVWWLFAGAPEGG